MFQKLIKKEETEVVLPGGVIEFSIINAHMPTSDPSNRNKLIMFILDNNHAPFLGYSLNRANPITIRNWINDSDIKKFGNLLLYNLLYIRV